MKSLFSQRRLELKFQRKLLALGTSCLLVFSATAAVSANTIHENAYEDLINEILEIYPFTDRESLIEGAENASRESGNTIVSVLETTKKSIGDSLQNQKNFNESLFSNNDGKSVPLSGPGGTKLIGTANNKGDVFYAPVVTSWFPHGHSGIFYSTSSIVEAPGGTLKSRVISTSGYYTVNNTALLSVNTTTTKRNAAANFAHTSLRDYKYSTEYLFNKRWPDTVLNCSQLVWIAYYKSSAGIDLSFPFEFKVWPIDIAASTQTTHYKTIN